MDEELRTAPLAPVKGWRGSLERLWRNRLTYERLQDWALSFYHRLILRLPHLPLPLRHSIREVRLANVDAPFYVRLGTTDWYVLEEIFIDRAYEPVVLRHAGGARHIVDLGANAGFSIRWWQLQYPEARITAVEPDAENLLLCERNLLKGDGADSVRLVQACVAGRERDVSLERSGGEWRFRMTDAVTEDAKGRVKALTMPQLLSDDAAPVDILKCDIEGAEAEVFADCSAWIGRVRQLVVEVHRPYSPEVFMEDLARGGGQFSLYHRVPVEDGSQLLFLEQTVQ